MKKLLATILCLMLVFCALSPAGAEGEAALDIQVLEALTTREELAQLLGIEDPAQTEQLLAYLKNYCDILPRADETADTGVYYAENGCLCLSAAQAQTLITPVVLTTENWKEYVSPVTETVSVSMLDENNEYVDVYEEMSNVRVRDGYCFSWNEFRLVLVDKVTGEQCEFDGDEWPYPVTFEDGTFTVTRYDENGLETAGEFSLDDYDCVFADAVIYSYNIPDEYLYAEEWDDEACSYLYRSASDLKAAGEEYSLDDMCAFIRFAEGADYSSLCLVGYSYIGSYVYTGIECVVNAPRTGAQVSTAPAQSLTTELLSSLTTREELAAAIGFENADELPQLLVYLQNYYDHLPSQNAAEDEDTAESPDYEGCKTLSASEARALITPHVVTSENWKDFIAPYMEKVLCYEYDEDGNETVTYPEEPQIGIKPGYYYTSMDTFVLIFKSNVTGEILDYTGYSWPENVVLKDGKYTVISYTEDDEMVQTEFDPDNYTCIWADCVVYEYELDPELLYVEYYDELTDSFVIVPADEYGDGFESPVVFIRNGESDEDISTVGYSALGNYIFIDCAR